MTINDVFQNLKHLREISKGRSLTFTLFVNYLYNDDCSNKYEVVDTLAELNDELSWLKDEDKDAADQIFGEKTSFDGTEPIIKVISYGNYNNPKDNDIIYIVNDHLSLNLSIEQ